MRLADVFQSEQRQPQFERFLRQDLSQITPPLNTSELLLERLVGAERIKLSTVVNGIGSLVIRYKGKEGAVASLDEIDEGETWSIGQVQGAKTKKSYRVATGIDWQSLFGYEIKDLATVPTAEVKRIVMPHVFAIQGFIDAASENIQTTYTKVRAILGMRYSDELGLYVVDVKK